MLFAVLALFNNAA